MSFSPLATVTAGKKWFMQPSLSAQHGQVVGKPVIFSNKLYKKVCVLATCHMRMETAAILVLRKILNPNNASHQAIIDQSEEMNDGHQHSSHGTAPPAAVSNVHSRLPAPQAGVKRQRTTSTHGPSRPVKREPIAVSKASRAVQHECIDLT